MADLIIIALCFAFAYFKAWADSDTQTGNEFWHQWSPGSYIAIAVAGCFCGIFYGWPGLLILAAALIFAQIPFEGFLSMLRHGYWYGLYSRSFPIEPLLKKENRSHPDLWSKWILIGEIAIRWGQIRFEGAWAPIWDAIRLILAGLIYWRIL